MKTSSELSQGETASVNLPPVRKPPPGRPCRARQELGSQEEVARGSATAGVDVREGPRVGSESAQSDARGLSPALSRLETRLTRRIFEGGGPTYGCEAREKLVRERSTDRPTPAPCFHVASASVSTTGRGTRDNPRKITAPTSSDHNTCCFERVLAAGSEFLRALCRSGVTAYRTVGK